MPSIRKFDSEGREYRCYFPGIPLRFDFEARREAAIRPGDSLRLEEGTGIAREYTHREARSAAAGAEVVRRAVEYAKQHPMVGIKEATNKVLDEDADLKEAYLGIPSVASYAYPEPEEWAKVPLPAGVTLLIGQKRDSTFYKPVRFTFDASRWTAEGIRRALRLWGLSDRLVVHDEGNTLRVEVEDEFLFQPDSLTTRTGGR